MDQSNQTPLQSALGINSAPPLDPEAVKKVESIDHVTDEARKIIVRFLRLVHEQFPLTTMPEDFRGTHSLTLTEDGKLYLCIWYKGYAYKVIFDD